MQTIQPCIWFDNQAEDAARLYTKTFANSKIARVIRSGKAASMGSGRPEGSVMTVDFELCGQRFLGLNGGPYFKVNPAMSFFVACDSERELTDIWHKLCHNVRIELKEHPFAKKYGWCEDIHGVNWQLILGTRQQKISPALLFANGKYGKAEAAINFYLSKFPDASLESIARDPNTNAVLHAVVKLAGYTFVFFEGPLEPNFDFSPAVSFMVSSQSQAEVDKIWADLSAVPQAEQCGWLQDRFGISWQIVHKDWGQMMASADPATQDRLMSALLSMKKPDFKALETAYRG